MTLLAWWKFDETSGTTAADSSGNGRDLTLVGSAAWLGTGLHSGSTKSLDLTGGRLELSTNADTTMRGLGVGSWTACGWLNGDDLPNSTMLMGHEYDLNKVNTHLGINRDSAYAALRLGSGRFDGSWNTPHYTTALSLTTTYFVATTYNSATQTLKLFIDGALVLTTTSVTPMSGSQATGRRYLVGSKWDGSASLMNGRIDSLALWDVALADADITTLFADMSQVPSVPAVPPSSRVFTRLKRPVNHSALARAVR